MDGIKMKRLFELAVIFIFCRVSIAQLKFSIIPSGQNIIVKENEDLNLTCKVSYAGPNSKSFQISWSLPVKISASRVSSFKGHNELSITVHNLQGKDKGRYICEVRDSGAVWRQKIDVIINTGNEKCSHLFFDCADGLCIPHHYVCDGFEDCPGGLDESIHHCGADACEGKFQCDGRCIPKHYCCDRTTDTNCSVNYFMPCCQSLINPIVPLDVLKMGGSGTPEEYEYHNIGFYQSTVYTMISCALGFIFMSAIMLMALCRIRMRAPWYPRSSTSNQRHRFWQFFQIDSRRTSSSLSDSESRIGTASFRNCPEHLPRNNVIDPLENYVLLTYENNTGFQVAEYGPKPPPYTETNIGIPPPPYSSTLDITSNMSYEPNEVPPPIDAEEQTEQSLPQQ